MLACVIPLLRIHPALVKMHESYSTKQLWHADIPPWADLKRVFNETWFIECDIDTAMQRVLERQIGHGRTPETAKWRVENNDRKNAVIIADTAARASLLVPSLPES